MEYLPALWRELRWRDAASGRAARPSLSHCRTCCTPLLYLYQVPVPAYTGYQPTAVKPGVTDTDLFCYWLIFSNAMKAAAVHCHV